MKALATVDMHLGYIEEIAESMRNVKNEDDLHFAYSSLIDEVGEVRYMLGIINDDGDVTNEYTKRLKKMMDLRQDLLLNRNNARFTQILDEYTSAIEAVCNYEKEIKA